MLRPDLVVNLPGGKQIVVDAKAPLQGVLDAQQARDESERERQLRDHARLLRKHVRALAEKAYWASLDSTPDFVVMFLPASTCYGAALEADPGLMQDAMAKHVLIATPTTLLALLHSVAYGWQQERVAESAQAIAEPGRELYGAAREALDPARRSWARGSTGRSRLQRDGRLLRVPRPAGRAALRGPRRGGRGARAARARAGHRQRPQRCTPPSASSTWTAAHGRRAAAVGAPAAGRRLDAQPVRRPARLSRAPPTSAADPRAGAAAAPRTACAAGSARAPARCRARRTRHHSRRDRRRALPARAAVQVDAVAVVEPAADLWTAASSMSGGIRPKSTRRAAPPRSRPPRRRPRSLPLAGVVLVVLDQVEHAVHVHLGQHADVLVVERVGADEQVVVDLGEAVGSKPVRHRCR